MDWAQETELIARWKEGDPAAKDTMVECVLPKVEGFAKKRVKDLFGASRLEIAQDAIQEAFIDAITKVESCKFRAGPPSHFSTFCCHITNNKVIDERRRQNRSHPALTSCNEIPHWDPADICGSEFSRCLVKALEELHGTQRSVFCLRTGCDVMHGRLVSGAPIMTNQQIGGLYGKSRSWAAKQYTQALVALVKRLRGFDPGL